MTVTISKAVKRDHEGARIVGPTKTHKSRLLSIDDVTLEVLDIARARREKWTTDGHVSWDEDSYVISWKPSEATPANPEVLTSRFARLTTKTGCPRVRFHDLRHVLATTLLSQGYDLAVVAGRLGHSSPVVTMRVYAHALASRDRQASGVMSALRLLLRLRDS